MAVLATALGPQAVRGDSPAICLAGCPFPLRPGDELWLLQSSCTTDPWDPLAGVSIMCLAGPTCTQPSNVDTLVQTAAGFHNVIIVHGYDYDVPDALQAGCQIYQRLVACPTSLPVRLILWAWPSERRGLRIRDIRVKTCRSEVEARRLGALLYHFAPTDSVALVGHSLGARIITGGLHYQAEQTLVAPATSGAPATGARPQVLLMAAAVDQSALLPGNAHGLATTQVRQMTVLYNPGDPILRRFDRGQGGQSLGRFGSCFPSALGPAYRQCDISPEIGHRHRLQFYLNAPSFQSLLRGLVTAPPVTWPSASLPATPLWTDRSPS